MIFPDRSEGVRLVTDQPHRATNITDATEGVRRNAPESEKDKEYAKIMRARRMDRYMKGG